VNQIDDLSELQQAALSEIFNLGVGQAAAVLNHLLKKEIRITVPEVLFLKQAEAIERFVTDYGHRMEVVKQYFNGLQQGKSFLVLSENDTMKIVERLVGSTLTPEEIVKLKPDVLTEMGNIVLNSCLGFLDNQLNCEFEIMMPEYHFGATENVLEADPNSLDKSIFVLLTDLGIENENLSGMMRIVVSFDNPDSFLQRLDEYVSKSFGISRA